MCLQIIYIKYMYKQDLALNNQQWVISQNPTQSNQTKSRVARLCSTSHN